MMDMNSWLSPLFIKRLKRFRSIRRSYWALLVLAAAYILSLGAEFIANNKPIVARYDGRFYFPVFFFYPERTFGGEYGTMTDYKELRNSPRFHQKGNFMIFPPIPYGPNESLLETLPGNPPTPPTWKNILGTDDRGRDILTRLIYGFRTSVTFALILVLIGMILGVFWEACRDFSAACSTSPCSAPSKSWACCPSFIC